MHNVGGVFIDVGILFVWSALIPGVIIMGYGKTKLQNAFANYYKTCVDIEVCTKYGIIITPYKTNPLISNHFNL